MKRYNYPFEFSELLLTNQCLDWLGFTEYWAGSGDFGDRRLDLGEPGAKYLIYEIDGKEDDADGYGQHPIQCCVRHYITEDFMGSLYFLHELYEDIKKRRTPKELNVFLEKCGMAHMMPYMDSYLAYIENKK